MSEIAPKNDAEKRMQWKGILQVMRRNHGQMNDLLADDAIEWYFANREGLDVEQKRQFAQWLQKSPLHVSAYLQIARLAHSLRKAADPELPVAELVSRFHAAPDIDNTNVTSQRRTFVPMLRSPWLLAAAASVAGVFAIGLGLLSPALRGALFAPQALARYETPHGGQLARHLDDGSVLTLNTDSAVVVRYSRRARRVDVIRGQAAFEVVHDPRRPFRVFAGSAEVEDVGTRFDVYLEGGSTRVTVIEGRVEVGPASLLERLDAHARGLAGAGGGIVQLGAGQQVRVVEGEVHGSAQVDPQVAMAWTKGQIVFTRQPLAAVVAEFNRYAPTPIEIDTPSLRDLAVSGSFNADDSESFLAFLRSLDGVKVETAPDRVIVSKP